MTTVVHVIVPDGIDDPTRPSGGNIYDRQLCRGLATLGWAVHEHHIAGDWPHADAPSFARLAAVVASAPDGAVVLIDGLIASNASHVLVPHASRLRLVVLMHMPLGSSHGEDVREREGRVLHVVSAVVATSEWTRQRLLDLYGLEPERVHVARPGVEAAELAASTADGGSLLCVAAVTPGKGHDVFLHALAATVDMPWHCVCVGSLDRDSGFAADIRRRALDLGLGDRISFIGPQVGAALERTYAAADLLVLPSRAETYGMVITEALARGLPVLTTRVGGVPEAMGHGDDGTRPGLLMAPEDGAALGAALRAWLGDPNLRARLRRAARQRRSVLEPWSTTASRVAEVLAAAP